MLFRSEEVGAEKPVGGDELADDKLSRALTNKAEFKQEEWEFTQEEWESFGIKDLRMKHVVKAGDKYFRPVDERPRYPRSAWIAWPFDERGQPAPPSLVRFPWLGLPTADKAALRLEEPRRVWVTLASRGFYDKHLHGFLREIGRAHV